MAEDINDCVELQDEVAKARPNIPQPIIALLAGSAGKLSRVMNTYMTPVTHEALPTKAAPGTSVWRKSLVRNVSCSRPFVHLGRPTVRKRD